MSPVFEVPAQAPMDVGEYLRILRRRAWVIVLVTVLTVVAAYAWASSRDAVYTAVGKIVVAQDTEKEGVVATQTQVVQSDTVHAQARRKLPDAPPVEATSDGESGTITLRAESTDPKLAAKSIDAHIDAYRDYLTYLAQIRLGTVQTQMSTLQGQIDTLARQARAQPKPSPSLLEKISTLGAQVSALRSQLPDLQVAATLTGSGVEVLRSGVPPGRPSTISTRNAMLIGLGVGLLLGVLAALLLELLDDSIRSREDLVRIAGAQVPVLAAIPVTRAAASSVVALEQPESPATEAYRSLRTTVDFATSDRSPCIAVTTAKSRAGKTETAANLAVLTAQLEQPTVLVDCDMRFPRVHDFFGVANTSGFTSMVAGASSLDAVRRVPGTRNLRVLPSGPTPRDPAELLASPRGREVLTKLQREGAVVIVDTPPLLLATDVLAMAPAFGGILLVVTARTTRKRHVRKALEFLRQVDAPLLGLVLQYAGAAEVDGFGEDRDRRRRGRQRSEPAPTLNGKAAARSHGHIRWSASPNGWHPEQSETAESN